MRTFSLFSVLLMVTGFACAQPGEFETAFIDNGRAIAIVAYNGNNSTVIIPDRINGLPVTVIRFNAFLEKGLTGITIPNTVTTIEGRAFFDNQLSSVVIPGSVTTIGFWAFARNQLTSVIISNSVTTIERNAFANNRLSSVVIPDSVTSIEGGAFTGNPITRITIGANVELVNRDAMGHGIGNAFDNGFDGFYRSQERRAGTYTLLNGAWSVR